MADAGRGPTRSVGATVILVDGALAAYLARGDRQLTTYLPEAEPSRSRTARAIALVLIDRARSGGESPRGMLIEEIDGLPPSAHPLAPYLVEAGFVGGQLGFQATGRSRQSPVIPPPLAGDGASYGEARRSAPREGGSHQSTVVSPSRQSSVSNPRRQSRSSVSSPFASRYFEDGKAGGPPEGEEEN